MAQVPCALANLREALSLGDQTCCLVAEESGAEAEDRPCNSRKEASKRVATAARASRNSSAWTQNSPAPERLPWTGDRAWLRCQTKNKNKNKAKKTEGHVGTNCKPGLGVGLWV